VFSREGTHGAVQARRSRKLEGGASYGQGARHSGMGNLAPGSQARVGEAGYVPRRGPSAHTLRVQRAY